MQARVVSGYEGGLAVGQRKCAVFIGSGPASYLAAGDPLTLRQFPYVDWVSGGITVSGTYDVEFQPSVAGPRPSWTAIWTVVATGAPVSPGTNLSAEQILGLAFGGDF